MNDEKLTRIVEAVAQQLAEGRGEEKSFGLKQARKLIAMVEAKAKTMGLNIVAAVSNEAGRPIAIECMDNSYIASFDVALNKAYTVVALKMSTKKLSTLAKPDGPLYGIQHTNGGQIVIFGGGDPLIYHGKIVGGLGVSGGSEEQDTALSAYGASCLDEIMNEN
ncbi:MAG: heme-binding protein [Clostridia bacterium]|nr:heme-binding protein [Oscillospiraceae bacterium]MBQ7959651.1 heme-binding protein [Clostridia bacterium]